MNENQIDAEKVRVEPVRAWATILKNSPEIQLSYLSYNPPCYTVDPERVMVIEVMITPVNYVLQEPVSEFENTVRKNWHKEDTDQIISLVNKRDILESQLTSSKERIAYLEAENGRLRSALKYYASDEFWMIVDSYDQVKGMERNDVARDALKSDKVDDGGLGGLNENQYIPSKYDVCRKKEK